MRLHAWNRRRTIAFLAGIGLALLAPAGASAQLFFYTGGVQTYDVPVGAGSLAVTAIGAPGGAGDSGASGGHGAMVRTTLPVTSDEVIYVYVGAVGPAAMGAAGGAASGSAYAGGGASGGSVSGGTIDAGGAGGGGSALRSCSPITTFLCFLSPAPLVMAGGGGGGGGGSNAGNGGAADGAGGLGTAMGSPAGPGLQNAGGAPGQNGTKGDLFVGGTGAPGNGTAGFNDGGGGGGGGGLFGGGGGGSSSSFPGNDGGGGGGGGSSMVSSSATGTTISTDATGVPQIMLTPIPIAPNCAGNALNTLPGGSSVSVVLPCTTPMGLTITYAISGAPRHGSLGQIDQTAGTVKYTPAPGFTGTDSFTFTATNRGGTSGTATATITIPSGAQTSHCVVPKLKGNSLSVATRRLVGAGCALGKVTKPKTRKHRRPPKNLVVVAQGSAPGTQLAARSKVAVTLGVASKRAHA
jgi:Glycine rich protein/Bacterial Ig domain